MIAGTLRYTAFDLEEANRAFAENPVMPVWQASLAVSLLGAGIGYGLVSIAQSAVIGSWSFATAPAWGGLLGSMALITIGSWRASKKRSPQFEAAINQEQQFAVSNDGIVLDSGDAMTSMKWTYFTDSQLTPNLISLRTKDHTVVLFKREAIQLAADWDRLHALVSEHQLSARAPS